MSKIEPPQNEFSKVDFFYLIYSIPGEVTKACRYDEPEWTDCDPFEMIRFRTLRLISGGRQCEEFKNITKHCTADELPPGSIIAIQFFSFHRNNFIKSK